MEKDIGTPMSFFIVPDADYCRNTYLCMIAATAASL